MEKVLRMLQRGIKGELREHLGTYFGERLVSSFQGDPSFFLRDLSDAHIFSFGLRTCCPMLPLLVL